MDRVSSGRVRRRRAPRAPDAATRGKTRRARGPGDLDNVPERLQPLVHEQRSLYLSVIDQSPVRRQEGKRGAPARWPDGPGKDGFRSELLTITHAEMNRRREAVSDTIDKIVKNGQEVSLPGWEAKEGRLQKQLDKHRELLRGAEDDFRDLYLGRPLARRDDGESLAKLRKYGAKGKFCDEPTQAQLQAKTAEKSNWRERARRVCLIERARLGLAANGDEDDTPQHLLRPAVEAPAPGPVPPGPGHQDGDLPVDDLELVNWDPPEAIPPPPAPIPPVPSSPPWPVVPGRHVRAQESLSPLAESFEAAGYGGRPQQQVGPQPMAPIQPGAAAPYVAIDLAVLHMLPRGMDAALPQPAAPDAELVPPAAMAHVAPQQPADIPVLGVDDLLFGVDGFAPVEPGLPHPGVEIPFHAAAAEEVPQPEPAALDMPAPVWTQNAWIPDAFLPQPMDPRFVPPGMMQEEAPWVVEQWNGFDNHQLQHQDW